MRAMKDSGIEWIGQIPQGWHVDRLKYCADLDSEKLSEKTDPEYAFNYIDISSVTEYGGIGSTQEMTFDKSPSRARMIVHDGDTIISTVRTYLKAIAYIDGLEDHICSTGFCVVTPNEKLHPKFGYYLLQSDYFVQKIVSESVGVSYPAISSTEIGNMSIAIPDPEEQTRIALHLDNKCAEIDALIAAKVKTNALLKERRQSIIYEAVTKGLNPDAPMKDSGVEWIGEIPEEWETRRIKYCFDVFAGATPKSGNSEFWDGDVVWVTPADYTTEQKYITQGRKYITQEGFESCSTEMIPAGSLIFSKRAPIGLVAINMVELCTNQGCLSCVPKDGNDVEYFYYAFSCFAEQFDLYGSGTTFKEISADAFVNFPIPFPSTEEQKEISEHLRIKCSELDTLISANEATIQKLKEYRQSIIYEAVTGKIEV